MNPTKKDIIAFSQEHGYTLYDINGFYDYYSRRGWRDSRGNPIAFWEKLVERWERTAREKAEGEQNTTPEPTPSANGVGFDNFTNRENDLDAEFCEEYKARYKKWAEENPRENDPYIVAIERGWTQEQKVKAIREQEELWKQGLKWHPPEEE